MFVRFISGVVEKFNLKILFKVPCMGLILKIELKLLSLLLDYWPFWGGCVC